MDRLNSILITPDANVRRALKQMDSAGEKTLFVVDVNGGLLGSLTDGNIRRWILGGGRLTAPVSKAMHKKPVTLSPGYAGEQARELMTSFGIECIPIINRARKVTGAIWWPDLFDKKPSLSRKKFDMPVVLMAGGEGTRLSPLTKVLPKPLMPIGNKTIIEHIMHRFGDFGCTQFYLSVNYKSSIIKAYLSDLSLPFKVKYIEESKPLGTAGSLSLLRPRMQRTFFVSNSDILIEADLADVLDHHRRNGNLITVMSSVKHYTIPYGVCKAGANGILSRIDEKPEYDFLVNTGMYMLEPEVLSYIPRNRHCHMTDLISWVINAGKRVGVYPISEKSWLDMGQFEELQEMLKRFGVDK